MRIRSWFTVPRLLLAVPILLALPALRAGAQVCPTDTPGEYRSVLVVTGCTDGICSQGTSIHLELEPNADLFLPPLSYDHGYEVAPCDEITWVFDDGSPTVVATGVPDITHTFTAAGNYTIHATIRNARGSATFTAEVIVGPIARVYFGFTQVPETASSVTIPVYRTEDTTRRVSAKLRVERDSRELSPALQAGDTEVVFEPGQTVASVVLPLTDNQVYDGTRRARVSVVEPEGGVLAWQSGTLDIFDDEPRPTLTVDDMEAREGDEGITRVAFTIRLSGPVSHNFRVHGSFWTPANEHTQAADTTNVRIDAGQTSATMELLIPGDTTPEPDLVLRYDYDPFLTGRPWAPLTGPDARVTILNDDAALTPAAHSGDLGQRVPMVLYPGRHFATEQVLPIRQTGAGITAPESLVIPAGASAVPFEAILTREGPTIVEVDLGDRIVRAELRANQPRGITGAPSSLTMTMHGTTRVTLALAPAHDVPVTLQLTADPDIVTVPRAITIPPGGETTFDVLAIGKGATAISITPLSEAIGGVAIPIDVLSGKRRAAR